jgi:hypothetical protein
MKGILIIFTAVVLLVLSFAFSSCKACNDEKEGNSAKRDDGPDMRNLVIPPFTSEPKLTPEERAELKRAWEQAEAENARLSRVRMAKMAQAKAEVQEAQETQEVVQNATERALAMAQAAQTDVAKAAAEVALAGGRVAVAAVAVAKARANVAAEEAWAQAQNATKALEEAARKAKAAGDILRNLSWCALDKVQAVEAWAVAVEAWVKAAEMGLEATRWAMLLSRGDRELFFREKAELAAENVRSDAFSALNMAIEAKREAEILSGYRYAQMSEVDKVIFKDMNTAHYTDEERSEAAKAQATAEKAWALVNKSQVAAEKAQTAARAANADE